MSLLLPHRFSFGTCTLARAIYRTGDEADGGERCHPPEHVRKRSDIDAGKACHPCLRQKVGEVAAAGRDQQYERTGKIQRHRPLHETETAGGDFSRRVEGGYVVERVDADDPGNRPPVRGVGVAVREVPK